MSQRYREFNEFAAPYLASGLDRVKAEMTWTGGAIVGDVQIVDALRDLDGRREELDWHDPEGILPKLTRAALDFEVFVKPIEKWDEENDMHAMGEYLRERGLLVKGSGVGEVVHDCIRLWRAWRNSEPQGVA